MGLALAPGRKCESHGRHGLSFPPLVRASDTGRWSFEPYRSISKYMRAVARQSAIFAVKHHVEFRERRISNDAGPCKSFFRLITGSSTPLRHCTMRVLSAPSFNLWHPNLLSPFPFHQRGVAYRLSLRSRSIMMTYWNSGLPHYRTQRPRTCR